MGKYLSGIDATAGGHRGVARLSSVLGANVSAANPSSVEEFLRDVKATAPPDVKDGATTVAGAAAGAFLWKRHRVLGLLGGGSLGRNVPALFRPSERRAALCNIGQTGGGVLGSLIIGGAPGFILGWLGAGVLIYFNKWRGE